MAQSAAAKGASEGLNGMPPTVPPPSPQWSEGLIITLTVSVLVFGLLICLLLMRMLARCNAKPTALEIIQAIAVPVVIVAMLTMIIAGYSDKQIAAPLGLLGAIVGYLLGSKSQTPPPPQPSPPDAGQTPPSP